MQIKVLAQVPGYEDQWLTPRVEGNVLNVDLDSTPETTALTGSLVPPPEKGHKIQIVVDGQEGTASSDELGRFKLLVNGRPGDRVRVKVYEDGKMVYDDYQVLPGPATLLLDEAR